MSRRLRSQELLVENLSSSQLLSPAKDSSWNRKNCHYRLILRLPFPHCLRLNFHRKIKSHHVRTKSRAQKELNSIIKRNLANESPNKSVSSTKLESYKLPTLNSRGMNRSPTRNESSFKKIKFHSACNTPARQGSMRSRALPMLPNVRDLLNPMGTKNGSHNGSQKGMSPTFRFSLTIFQIYSPSFKKFLSVRPIRVLNKFKNLAFGKQLVNPYSGDQFSIFWSEIIN